MTSCFALIIGLLSLLFGTWVKIDVSVHNEVGEPVTNAVVRIETLWKLDFDAGRDFSDYKTIRATTDKNGHTTLYFYCLSGNYRCYIDAPGYYPEQDLNGRFDISGSFLLGVFLKDWKKKVSFTMWRKRHPIKMVEHSERENPRMPMDSGTFGFDLQKSDWLPPYGMGDVADFWIDYKVVYENGGKETYHARMYFTDPGAGFYVRAKNKSYRFWSDYRADANAHYERERSSFDAVNTSGGRKDIIGDGEYLVLRTRTKVDKDGKIVSAHYSRMFGTVGFSTRFYTGGYSFNPHPNDTNLESDRY